MRNALRNVTYNLVGQLLPMAVAFVALPLLAHQAGAERLGFLALAWSLIGQFSLLDFGLSRVITRRVARAEAAGSLLTERRVVQRLCLQLFTIMIVVCAVLALVVPSRWFIGSSPSAPLLAQVDRAFLVLWTLVPVTVATGILRGALEGMQRFAKANLLRAFFGASGFLAPLVALQFTDDLAGLTLSIGIVRILSLAGYAILSDRAFDEHLRLHPEVARDAAPQRPTLRSLAGEGGWLAVSNIVGSSMSTFDRFAIAAILSLTAASQYFVPQEVALRLLVIPAAVVTTIFPMLSRYGHDAAERPLVQRESLLAIAAACFPMCVAMCAFAQPLLSLWMGPTFAVESAPVATILGIGLFANCCAQAPMTWIQAAGHSKVPAIMHLIELPLYLMALTVLTWRFGIIGAAAAWSLRAMVDAALLMRAAEHLFPGRHAGRLVRLIVIGELLLLALAIDRLAGEGWLRTPMLFVVLTACGVLTFQMTDGLRRRAVFGRAERDA